MTAPTTPQPTATARWYGDQWIDWNGVQWVPAVAVPTYTQPPPPPPAAGYGQGAPPPGQQPTKPVLPTGDFKTFFQQKSGGTGPFWKYHKMADNVTPYPPGTTHWGIVARPLTETDVVPQTDGKDNIVYQNGNIKWQLEVPFRMVPTPEHTDGVGRMGFKSDSRDKLNSAMAFAGAPEHPDGGYVPEAGAFIQVTKLGERQTQRGWNPAIVYEVVYRRPDDPWTITKTAEVAAAHHELTTNPIQPAGPPPQPVWDADARTWVIPQQAWEAHTRVELPAAAPQVPPPSAPRVPPTAPEPAADATAYAQYAANRAAYEQGIAAQAVAPPAVPPAVPAPDAAALAQYAAYMAAQTAAAPLTGPPAAATTPAPPPAALGTPGAPAGSNGQPPPAATAPPAALQVPPPAGANGAPVQVPAAGPAPIAEAPQITVQQWENMTPQQRGALEAIVKIRCPDVGSAGQALEVIGGLPRS